LSELRPAPTALPSGKAAPPAPAQLGAARRAPLIGLLAVVLVAGGAVGAASGGPRAAGAPGAPGLSAAPSAALSSSWFCAGASAYQAKPSPRSEAPGKLIFDNAGSRAVRGTVALVSAGGARRAVAVSVPPGRSTTLSENLAGPLARGADAWAGAIVTLYGGLASVSQLARTSEGVSVEPCASTASSRWYFAGGATLRNTEDFISLLNPYPSGAIADLSFTTNQGQESPLAFQGIVVPAMGLAVVDLGAHLRRRWRIATTVTTRTGELVAFETEMATPAPPGVPPVGTPGAANPALPVPGVSLLLGSDAPSSSLWWPDGGEGPGYTETYYVYDPGPKPAHLVLGLVSGQAAGAGLAAPGPAGGRATRAQRRASSAVDSSYQFDLPGWGAAAVTTNGQPWALAGAGYAVHLESLNGAGVVAQRSVMAASPAPTRGLAAIAGEAVPADEWIFAGTPRAASSALSLGRRLGELWLAVVDPGPSPAVVELEEGGPHGLRHVRGSLRLAPGQRASMLLPSTLLLQPLVVRATVPVLAEQDGYYTVRGAGTLLGPGVVVQDG
jgi:hypothetical protein